MNDFAKQISTLSLEKRALLASQMKKKGIGYNSFPLSFAQQRLWFLDQLYPGNISYNIPTPVRLTGSLNVQALRLSINEIIQRHEVLRTTFSVVEENPVQLVAPIMILEIPEIDLLNIPETIREQETRKLINQDATTPFNLGQGPLIRASLIKIKHDEYILLFTMHHIVSDGWSIGVFIREIIELYRSFTNGKTSMLPRLPIQYADFSLWQRKFLSGENLDKQLHYWQDTLLNVPPVLDLPLDRPRQPGDHHSGSSQALTIAPELSQALLSLSQKEGTTLFMTLLAAFQVLLGRYSNQDDICVGTPIANRNRAETTGLIGFFINTLVLRTDLSGNPTFTELLKRVREAALGAYAHQDLPFEMLVEKLNPDRDMSHTPLFQVMFALQNTPTQAVKLPGVELNPIQIENEITKFDLTLNAIETPDGIKMSLEYKTDLFNANTISRMLGHLVVLLQSIVKNPEQPISTLLILTALEEQQILTDWNDTQTEFLKNRCLHELFEAQVELTPAAIAVDYLGHRLTFAELNQKANHLAHYLRQMGVGPDQLVGLCFERSWEMVVAIMGILKAGAAYLPLDPAYPVDRLAFMLEDSQTTILVTQDHLVGSLPVQGIHLIRLDGDWDLIAQQSSENPENFTHSTQLAYVIYTSGSTGKPKGVMISHRSAVNLMTGLDHAIYQKHLGPGTHRISVNAPLPFDASVQQIVMLALGHTLYVVPHEVRMDGTALLNFIRSNRLEVLDCVPTQLKILISEGMLTNSDYAPPVILPGGEAIDEMTWRVLQSSADVHFYNVYGPTECTVDSTFCHINHAPEKPVIGRPVNNAQIYILDSELNLAPIGVPGEIYIGGAGLARGYLNRPGLTAEKFVPNPFVNQAGARLYRSGDLARYLPEGNIEFLGRIDHQVKLRGFRIELGEIEALLNKHPNLKHSVVIVREDQPGDKRIVAYLVAQQEPAPSLTVLRNYLKDQLPDYMVPATFVYLQALPLTPNGKVNRRALPIPDQHDYDADDLYVAPRSPIEEILVNIWSAILGPQRISIHDNFFNIGGHSLLATQVVSRIRDTFKVELPLKVIFEDPTIAKLAQAIEIAQSENDGNKAPALQPITRDADIEMPLSFGQLRLWFLDQLEPGSPFYNIPTAVRINGDLNVVALEQAVQEIVRRHEILRTNFRTVDGRPVQVIGHDLDIDFAIIDLSGFSETEREEQSQKLATIEAQTPFDLSQDRLLRIKLFYLAPTEYLVLYTMHHIISDGWSAGVFIRELALLYDAFSKDRPSPLPELAIQYADFAFWQRQWLQGEVLKNQLAYWKNQLGDSPPLLELPTDRPRPAVQSFHGRQFYFELPADLSAVLREVCRKEGSTLFMLLLAGFQTLLYRYSGQEDVNVGSPIANRTRGETESIIGLFINTLVFRSTFAGNPTFRDLLQKTRLMALEAYAHQDLPFEQVVDTLQPERNLSHTPLFQVMFVFQNTPRQVLELPDLTFNVIEADPGTAQFDITLTMVEIQEALKGSFEYNTDLFDESTIQRLVSHFTVLLQNIAKNIELPVAAIPLLPDQALQQITRDWNATGVVFPEQKCIHALFEEQARRSPEAIAVRYETEELTFAALNRRANQLANYLRTLGVGPEVLVGICLEKSIPMIVGLLGILKAGGAYVPIDPKYPKDRIDFMLQDTQAPVLLTSRAARLQLPEYRGQMISLDENEAALGHQSEETPVTDVQPGNLAYIIFTSGSTGKPKGVQVEHRSLVNYATYAAQRFAVGPVDRILQFASISFDAAGEEIYPALIKGAQLVLRTDAMLGSVAIFLEKCHELNLTILDLPTAYWHQLTQELVAEQMSLPETLRLIIIGGERAIPDRVRDWHKGVAKPIQLFNTYGPTEATIVATNWELYENAASLGIMSEVPIGKPVANAQAFVLNRYLEIQPVGIPGELYLGGLGIARGYLSRPDLTAEKFVPNPFAENPGERLYRTGDLVRFLPDGNLEFLGRIDHQVKIRGFRIELGEIEAILCQHPALKDALVVAQAKKSQETGKEDDAIKRLVAYCVPKPEQKVNPKDLKDYLKDLLPDYMIPAYFVEIPTIPLNQSGKVDVRALPEPEHLRPELGSNYLAPRNAVEETLVKIMAQVIGVDKVGVNDNFFELGGDSILSIQLIARANQAGIKIAPMQLFQYQTIAGLASVAETVVVTQADQGIVTGPVPLTPIQHWFFEQNFLEPQHWNQSLFFQVNQAMDAALLAKAARALIEHHDALRLRFYPDASGWHQINAEPDDRESFSYFDLSAVAESELRATIEKTALELQKSLDLSQGPLLRVAYFNLGANRPARLFIVIHHLAVDGVSWRILLEDLQTIYQQLALDQPVILPSKTTSFQHWAQKLSEFARSDRLHQEFNFWQPMTSQQPALLPMDFADGLNDESSVAQITRSLSVAETQTLLQEVPATYHTQINEVLLTALAQAFMRWTGRRALLVDLEGHGREQLFENIDISRTVGWFTTVYPVLLDLKDAYAPGDAIKTIKEAIRAIPNRGIGYGLLRYLSDNASIKEKLRQLPSPEVSFNYLGQFNQSGANPVQLGPAPESQGPDHGSQEKRAYLLDFSGGISNDQLNLSFAYSKNIHRSTTIEQLANYYLESLRSLIAHCKSDSAGGFTPSDFKLAKLDQKKLDKVLTKLKK